MGTPGTRSARSPRRRLERGKEWLAQAEERHTAVRLAVELVRRDRAASGSVLAAALAARIFLWALPFALLATAVLGFLGAGSDALDSLSGWLLPDPELREQLGRAAEQAEEGRYVTANLGVALLVIASVSLGRTMDGVVTGVWGLSRPGTGARLRRAARYSGTLVGIAATHVAALAVPSGPAAGALAAAVTFCMFVLLARAMLGVDGTGRSAGAARGAVLVATGLEAMRLVGFYYLPHKLQRSSELYGTLGVAAALLLWLTILARLVVLGHVLNAWHCSPTSTAPPARTRAQDVA